MTTTSATGNDRRGFTLIELSIVVFILTMLMAASVPYFVRSYNEALLSGTARSLITTCQLARHMAVLHQRPTQLHLDLGKQMYWLAQEAATEEEAASTIRSAVLPSRVMMVSVQLADQPAQNQGEFTVRFFPNGTAEHAVVILRGQERGRALAVVIDPVTGRGQAYPAQL